MIRKQENETINYKDILNDQIIIDEYSKIDKINKFHFNHGLRHVTNVTNIMNKLTDVIGVDIEQKDDLLIAAALHDIGQVENRQNHALKGKLFAANYLDGKIKGIRLKKILSSIEFHNQKENLDELPLFTNLVVFADKMDFTYKRLEDDWETRESADRKKFGDIFENIMDIDFEMNDSQFIVLIKATDSVSVDDISKKHGFFYKVINSTEAFAKKLNLDSLILVNGVAVKETALWYL